MDQPQYFVVRCPNGHELRTTTDQVGRTLACPICSATFTPDAPAPAPPTQPRVLSYGSTGRSRSIKRPIYTTWMLTFWITYTALQFLSACANAFWPPTAEQLDAGGGIGTSVTMLFGCLGPPVGLAAVVMQGMWIYRIHSDARDGLKYHDVSPGLALGMTFVPIAQYIFTGWTMLRLARVTATLERISPAIRSSAVRWGKLCILAAIVMQTATLLMNAYAAAGLMSKIGFGTTPDFNLIFREMQALMTSGSAKWYLFANHAVALLAVLVYAAGVRAVERAVYQPGTLSLPG